MLYSGNKVMQFAVRPAVLALVFLVTSQLAIRADNPAPGDDVVVLASSGSSLRLLPDMLAGQKATSDAKRVGSDRIADVVGAMAPIYQEYFVVSAGWREYAGARVDVFETRNQFAALGLFQFSSEGAKTKNRGLDIGSESAQLDDAIIFWKGNFIVRVSGSNQKGTGGTTALHVALARAVANSIVAANPAETRPPLFDSLPSNLPYAVLMPGSQRYFLGSESLNTFVEHGRDMFEFRGDTEAVVAQYTKAGGEPIAGTIPAPLKLVIVECHTPEFATDELARVSSYVESLSEIEQQKIIFKRTGNYIVAAVDVGDREFAEGLVNSVQYPYTVKWLRNPLWPTNDPFRAQKAAEMLLSTFGLLGLILLTVLVGGTVFGASVFLKRRKRQREIFSDAGGMLRLDIEPYMLALPPKRDE
jgi:hypothetical protein